MQNQKTPNALPFILIFLFTDLLLLGITISLENYASFEGFLATLISSVWVVLLGIAFIALILSIILIRNYLALRNALIESFMVLIFALWFGIARIPIINDGGANHYILFALGSFLLLTVNIAIQIDLLLAPSIKGFLTTDKKDRQMTQPEAAQKQPEPFLIENRPQIEKTPVKHTSSVSNSQGAERTIAQERPVRTTPAPQTAKTASKSQTSSFTLEDLTEEQRKQFQEYQAKRRAARLAALQHTRQTSAVQEQAEQAKAPSSTQPSAQKNDTASIKNTHKRDDSESLFF